jgi:ABC-type transporter Mla subunit MlaD
MNEKRSIIVGLFVLVGAALLGVMIFWFGQVAFLIRGGYVVHGHLPSAVGVRAGKRVHMDGIDCGEVQNVRTSQPQKAGVWVDMHINRGILIPTDAAFVAQQSTIGDLYLDFQTTLKKPPEAAPAPPSSLPTDGTAYIEGHVVAPSLLPEELVADVRKGLSTLKALEPVAANIQKLTEPRTLKDVEAGQPRNLWTMIEQFEVTGKTLQDQLDKKDSSFNTLLAEADISAKKLQETLDAAKKTLAAADETFKKLGAKTDTLADDLAKSTGDARDLIKKLDKAVEGATTTMNTVNRTFENINKGQGTLGKLATDDELHRALTTLLEDLQSVADNADRLIIMWRKEGITAKEGK